MLKLDDPHYVPEQSIFTMVENNMETIEEVTLKRI
jgi:hypothetical protein